jgi:hypothetical protein
MIAAVRNSQISGTCFRNHSNFVSTIILHTSNVSASIDRDAIHLKANQPCVYCVLNPCGRSDSCVKVAADVLQVLAETEALNTHLKRRAVAA